MAGKEIRFSVKVREFVPRVTHPLFHIRAEFWIDELKGIRVEMIIPPEAAPIDFWYKLPTPLRESLLLMAGLQARRGKLARRASHMIRKMAIRFAEDATAEELGVLSGFIGGLIDEVYDEQPLEEELTEILAEAKKAVDIAIETHRLAKDIEYPLEQVHAGEIIARAISRAFLIGEISMKMPYIDGMEILMATY